MRSLGWGFRCRSGVEPLAVEGLVNMPYACRTLKVDCVLKNTHVPVMFWRSVGCSQNAFAVESFIDELAHDAGQDPYQFRRKLLAGKPDFLGVLDVLAREERTGASRCRPAQGRGIAIHESFGTIVGEVRRGRGRRQGRGQGASAWSPASIAAMSSIRCTVEMQIESGVIYGLTAALFGEITIKDGAVEQGNFDTYQMVRHGRRAHDRDPSGAVGRHANGAASASRARRRSRPPLCNAIFAATGQRVRELPVGKTDFSRGV